MPRCCSISVTGGTFVALILLVAPIATAQGPGRGFPSPEEMFDRVDKNGDGVLTGDEIRDSGRMSRMFEGMGIDGSQPVSKQQFGVLMQQGMERFRERMRSGGGFGPPGGGGMGGPPGGGYGGPSGGGGEDRRDRRDRDRETPSVAPTPIPGAPMGLGPAIPAQGSVTPGSPAPQPGMTPAPVPAGKTAPVPKPRVTLTLPDSYRNQDQNRDGQIGLYEWNRRDWLTFQRLDRDSDGFLTPKELVVASGGSPSSSTAVAVTSPPPGGSPAVPGAAPPSAAPGATPTAPAPVAVAATTPPDSSRATGAFDALDVDKDGSISPEEWGRSRTMRPRFEAAGLDLTKPTPKASFLSQFERVMGSR